MKVDSIISYYDPESVGATEFRRLYSNIRKSAEGQLKSVLVTSSSVEEGKSTVSSFLAISVAESTDQKVLLLDTDLRRPMINVLFKMPLEKGFADLLENRCSVKDTIKQTAVKKLSVITAGKLDSEPSMILQPNRIREVFEELKFYFDFIVIDVPPVIPVSDPVIIAGEVDGTLLVVRAGTTPRDVVKRSVNFLRNAKVNVIGIVLNNLEEVLPYYYSSHYYSYKYYNKTGQAVKK